MLIMAVKLNEDKLVCCFQVKDKLVVEEIYDFYVLFLYGIVLYIVKLEVIVQDVVQEIFIKVWKNVVVYDMKKGIFFIWLFNIIWNGVIDKICFVVFW